MVHRLVILISCAAVLVGCASRPIHDGKGGRFPVEPGMYTLAFDQTRDELVALGFVLDRVDARAGVLTTKPLASGGLATPWDRQQVGLMSELADMAHPQQRVVRVTFVPAQSVDVMPSDDANSQISAGSAAGSVVLLSEAEQLVGLVHVTIERVYRPYWRLSTVVAAGSGRARDPSLRSRGMSREFSVVTQRDHALEERLASRVGSRLQPKQD